jgi:hypothetical protein
MSDLYFRQLPVGPMANFIYLIGSKRTRECLIVDPAWDSGALVDLAAQDGMTVTGRAGDAPPRSRRRRDDGL